MHLLLLDTETTGLEQQDRLIQVAFTFRENGKPFKDNGWVFPRAEYFKAPVPISYEAMAVHHITPERLDGKPPFAESSFKEYLEKRIDDSVFIAHNAKFDLGMMEKEGIKFKLWIDTQRVAMHLFESQSYKLQYLRYFLGLKVNQNAAAHDAAGDVSVLEALFDFLFEKIKKDGGTTGDFDAIINHMMTLSITPILIRKFNFGKYKGKSFSEVLEFDRGYFTWLYTSEMSKMESERNEDLMHTLKSHLQHN